MSARPPDPGRIVREDLVAAVLAILSTARGPIGASTIHAQLLRDDFDLSEPTVGRLLRELDRLGYTTPRGRLGRSITPKGRRTLGGLQDRRDRQMHARHFVAQLRTATLADLINILLARRGVERELARAAATNATVKDLAEFRTHYEAIKRGETLMGLHEELARASHNPVLGSVSRMLRRDAEIARLLERVLEERGDVVDLPFGRRLIDAIRRHDPDAAEKAVADHFDGMLAMARLAWSATRGRRRATASAK